MKHILILLITSVLLTGCGQKIHENISEGLVEDTEQVIAIFDETIKDERALTDKEEKIFQEYIVKYETMKENPEVYNEEFTDEEDRLFVMTQKMIEEYDYYTSPLSSDQENYEGYREMLYRVIETGQIYE